MSNPMGSIGTPLDFKMLNDASVAEAGSYDQDF